MIEKVQQFVDNYPFLQHPQVKTSFDDPKNLLLTEKVRVICTPVLDLEYPKKLKSKILELLQLSDDTKNLTDDNLLLVKYGIPVGVYHPGVASMKGLTYETVAEAKEGTRSNATPTNIIAASLIAVSEQVNDKSKSEFQVSVLGPVLRKNDEINVSLVRSIIRTNVDILMSLRDQKTSPLSDVNHYSRVIIPGSIANPHTDEDLQALPVSVLASENSTEIRVSPTKRSFMFTEVLSSLIKESGMKKSEVAFKLGMQQGSLSLISNGTRFTSQEHLFAMAELLCGKDEDKRRQFADSLITLKQDNAPEDQGVYIKADALENLSKGTLQALLAANKKITII